MKLYRIVPKEYGNSNAFYYRNTNKSDPARYNSKDNFVIYTSQTQIGAIGEYGYWKLLYEYETKNWFDKLNNLQTCCLDLEIPNDYIEFDLSQQDDLRLLKDKYKINIYPQDLIYPTYEPKGKIPILRELGDFLINKLQVKGFKVPSARVAKTSNIILNKSILNNIKIDAIAYITLNLSNKERKIFNPQRDINPLPNLVHYSLVRNQENRKGVVEVLTPINI